MSFRVLWRHTLADGHTVQVVQAERDGHKEIEIVAPWGASLETGGGAECVRFEVTAAADFDALIGAIDEARENAHERETGETGRSSSAPPAVPSTGPAAGNGVERPDSNNSGRSDVSPVDERGFAMLVISELPACTTCNRIGHLAADCPNEGGSRGQA